MTYPRRPIKAFNPWLKGYDATRGANIVGIQIHSTRSGKSDGDDGPRTEGWWANPQNNQGGWGSYADFLIFEDGTQVQCTNLDSEYPKYTAGFGYAGSWNASFHYIQVEVAQGNPDDPFTDAEIESLGDLTIEMSGRYNFPLVRIPYLYQSQPPQAGIATHEDSDNGKIYGKSDPGPMFPWEKFMALATGKGGDDMTPEEHERLVNIEAAVTRLERAMYGDLDPSTGQWENVFEEIRALSAKIDRLSQGASGAHIHGE